MAVRGQRGITLVELLVASVILVVIITPLCLLFSMSSRTIANARQLTIATSLTNSYLSAVRKVPVSQEFEQVKDTDAPPMYTPSGLGIQEAVKGFARTIGIYKLESGASGAEFYRVCVIVEWEGIRAGKTRKFSLDTIVTGGGGT